MKITAILSVILTIAMVVGAMMGGAPLVIFFDVFSLMVVGGGTFFLMIAAHGPAGPFTYICGGLQRLMGLGSPDPWGSSERKMAVQVARSGGRSAILLGGVGGLIGLIQMLINMDDPTHIGPAMAVALLSCFYAVLLNLFIFVPLARHFSEAGIEAETGNKSGGQA
jgi:flagellar motor component MotA